MTDTKTSFALLAGIATAIIISLLLIPSQSDDTIFFIKEDNSGAPTPCTGNLGLVLAQNFTDLCDVTIINPATDEIVSYNGSQWVNIDSTTLACTNLNCLTDVVIVSPTTNEILTYNGTHWVDISTAVLTALIMNGNIDMNDNDIIDIDSLQSGTPFPLSSFGTLRLANGDAVAWRESFEASDSFISVTSDVTDDYFSIFIDGHEYLFYEDNVNLQNTDLLNVNDLTLNDQDGTPVADRQLRDTDGEIRSTDTSDVEGRYISKDSIELGLYENNTASNLGSATSDTEGIFAQKSGVDLQFKRLLEGTGISLSSNATHITIANSGVTSVTSNNNSTIGVVPTSGNVVLYPKYELLCQTTLASSNATISCNNFNARTNLEIKIYARITGTSLEPAYRFNGDSGNNYAFRVSANGGADGGATSTSRCNLGTASSLRLSGDSLYTTLFIENNNSSERKILNLQSVAGAGTSSAINSDRWVGSCKWDNISNQVTSITIIGFTGVGSFNTGSQLTVWGYN